MANETTSLLFSSTLTQRKGNNPPLPKNMMIPNESYIYYGIKHRDRDATNLTVMDPPLILPSFSFRLVRKLNTQKL